VNQRLGRAQTSTAKLIFRTKASWKDPARFYLPIGKDDISYLVAKKRCDDLFDSYDLQFTASTVLGSKELPTSKNGLTIHHQFFTP
jgi:hypothetical protein